MNAAELQAERPFSLPTRRSGYVLATLGALLVSFITGLNWQAGLTIALICGYMVLVSIRLEWGIYAIVAFAALCIDGWTLSRSSFDVVFRLAIGHAYIMELAVYGLLFVYLVKRAFDPRSETAAKLFLKTPLNRPLLVFGALMPLCAVYGLIRGNPQQIALGYYEWRALFAAIVFFFLASTLFNTKQNASRLFWWFLSLTCLIGVYSLCVYLLGSQGPFPFIFGSGPVGEGPENYTFVMALLGAIAWLMFSRTSDRGKRSLVLAGTLILALNVLVSQKRDPQLGLLVGLAVLVWRAPLRQKLKCGFAIVSLLVVALLVTTLLGIRGGQGGLEKSASRYTEVVDFFQNPKQLVTMEGETSLFHVLDIVDAFNSARQRPILGYGFGGEFQRKYTAVAFVGGSAIAPGIVHNQYLDLWIKMGILGLAAFLWIIVRFLKVARSSIPLIPLSECDSIALGLYAAVWADLAIEFWGSNWRGGTKMPFVILLVFVLVMGLTGQIRNAPIARETES